MRHTPKLFWFVKAVISGFGYMTLVSAAFTAEIYGTLKAVTDETLENILEKEPENEESLEALIQEKGSTYPLPGQIIELCPTDKPPGDEACHKSATNDEGYYKIENVIEGSYSVMIPKRSGETAQSTEFFIEKDAQLKLNILTE